MRARGAEAGEDAPDDGGVEEGPPIAEESGEGERDFASSDDEAFPAEDVVAIEDEAPAEPVEEDLAGDDLSAEENVAEEAAPPPEEDVAVEDAPPEEEVAAERAAPPQAEEVAVQPPPEEPEPQVAAPAQEPAPLALVPPAEAAAAGAVAPVAGQQPLQLVPPGEMDPALARNRAIAEELAARRRAGSNDGPQILLGGRGLQ
jgi:hypothetical protein